MDSNTTLKPQSTLETPQCTNEAEFDPFSKAKPCSPFYLYNHDSPRPSTDQKGKPPFSVSIHDLESGSQIITPTITQEKVECTKQTSRLGVWRGMLLSRRCQQMTKPKEKSWLQKMPKRQRIIVKLVIALIVIGCMVGIAVGIAVGLRSTVWKSSNQSTNIA